MLKDSFTQMDLLARQAALLGLILLWLILAMSGRALLPAAKATVFPEKCVASLWDTPARVTQSETIERRVVQVNQGDFCWFLEV